MQRKPQAKSQAAILVRELKSAGLDFQHQKALEIVAKMSGFIDWNTMSKAVVEESASKAQPGYDSNPLSRFDPKRQIALLWSIDDVQSVCPDLTDDEAFEVLHSVGNRHDASYGVTWETLSSTADWTFEARVIPCQYFRNDDDDEPVAARLNLRNGRVLLEGADEDKDDESLQGLIALESLGDERFEVSFGRLFAGDTSHLANLTQQLHETHALTEIVEV